MTERYINKKEMAERLGMEYLTFWRKLKGKRGIDVVLLMDIAHVLGTSAAYLLGETDNPSSIVGEKSVIIRTNDPSREIVSKPSKLSFHDGDIAIDIPDTPDNKKWFDDFIRNVMLIKLDSSKNGTHNEIHEVMV
ncbi:MAG: helix-turn-helix transcriptional regulator [Synergistaceae bacterium]|nr:helix-turn-helix transcriptional regulator [Synergistaceae bacterium]